MNLFSRKPGNCAWEHQLVEMFLCRALELRLPAGYRLAADLLSRLHMFAAARNGSASSPLHTWAACGVNARARVGQYERRWNSWTTRKWKAFRRKLSQQRHQCAPPRLLLLSVRKSEAAYKVLHSALDEAHGDRQGERQVLIWGRTAAPRLLFCAFQNRGMPPALPLCCSPSRSCQHASKCVVCCRRCSPPQSQLADADALGEMRM